MAYNKGATNVLNEPSKNTNESANLPTRMDRHLDSVTSEILAVTYWFDPPPTEQPCSYTIRLVGKRTDVEGKLQPTDQFSQDVTVNEVIGGSGPVAVLAKIDGVNPGTYEVSATMVSQTLSGTTSKKPAQGSALSVHRAGWSWRKWQLSAAPITPVETCLAPFARTPAVILGSWAALVAMGVVVAVGMQLWMVETLKLDPGHVLIASIAGLLAGGIGGKLWFVILHLSDKSRNGWCLQGMVAGIVVVFPAVLELLRLPIASVIDASTPGIMIGLAIGRLGCFFTGCCAGRPTRSRWGVWSSDRYVGMRRIPTQLMESGLAFLIGMTVFTAIHFENIFHGALFVAALSAYTLVRQGLLRLRQEGRKSSFGGLLTAVISALVLTLALMFLTIGRL